MPLVLKKIYYITGNYTTEQLAILKELIDLFRLRVADDDPEKNVLIGKVQAYTDDIIVGLLRSAINDINGGYPRTNYTLFNHNGAVDEDLIIEGAIVFSLIREGLLQLRNQIDYSDSGLTIAMFNKTTLYQSWAGMMFQQYTQNKQDFKGGLVLSQNANAGFVGITSEYGYRRWW